MNGVEPELFNGKFLFIEDNNEMRPFVFTKLFIKVYKIIKFTQKCL